MYFYGIHVGICHRLVYSCRIRKIQPHDETGGVNRLPGESMVKTSIGDIRQPGLPGLRRGLGTAPYRERLQA